MKLAHPLKRMDPMPKSPAARAAKSTTDLTADPGARLSSLDALRGFVMFWILGGDQIFPQLDKVWHSALSGLLAPQFDHVPWHGLVFYDLIFPTFMFAAGASMPYAFAKHFQSGKSKAQLYAKVIKRGLAIIAFGLVFNGLLQFEGLEHLRWLGVLQRIGFAYLFGALIFMNTGVKSRLAAVAVILLSYWGVMMLVPVPGFGPGNLSPEGNLAGYIDRLWLRGGPMCCYEFGDNEGFISNWPAITTVLFGTFAGVWLRSGKKGWGKALGLVGMGLAALSLGYAWNPWFPINKNLWTSPFALAAAGWSFLMLAVFYSLMDVQGWKRWAFAFTLIGMNSITIYMGQQIIDFGHIGDFFVKGAAAHAGAWGDLVRTAGMLAAKIGFLYVLYRQKLFLRL